MPEPPLFGADFAIGRLDVGGREAETLGAHAHKRLAGRCRGLTDLHSTARDPGVPAVVP